MAKVSPFATKLYKLLELTEKVFLATSVLALALKRFDVQSNDLLILALGGLSTVYFLMAQRPAIQTEDTDSEEIPKLGFFDLLVTTIAPKVGWISCSVAVVGILFWYQKWEGFKQMLLLGGSTLVVVSLLVGYAVIKGNKALIVILMRTVSLCLICASLLSKDGFFC
ncbi:MAG: hypothetical protein ACKO1F_07545 [Flammeovirgaceae bacterium]